MVRGSPKLATFWGFYGAFLRKIPVNSFIGDDIRVYRYAAVKVHIPDPFA